MFWNYPHSDYHELNLDWIIAQIKRLTGEVHDFKIVNKITFFGDWDITKQYPAWSIVNVGLADGYISIQPVPVGVNYTNTDYWVHVANYSALYADMQNRIIALENTVGDASSGLVKDVDDLQNDVAGIKADMKTKAVYIGNSYINGVGSTSGTDGLYNLTKDLFDEASKYTDGGAGFLQYSGHITTFTDLLNTAASGMTQEEREAVTHIIAVSAYGDTRYFRANFPPAVSTYITAIESFIAVRDTYFPNAEIYIALAEGVAREGVNDADTSFFAEYGVHDIFRTASKYCNFNYLGFIGWEITHLASMFSSDEYHPNDNGYNLLKNAFINAFHGCYEPTVKREEIVSSIGPTCEVSGTPDETVITFGTWDDAGSISSNIEIIDFSSAKICPACYTPSSLYYSRGLIWDDNANIAPKRMTFNFTTYQLKASSSITLTSGKSHEILSPLVIKHRWRPNT